MWLGEGRRSDIQHHISTVGMGAYDMVNADITGVSSLVAVLPCLSARSLDELVNYSYTGSNEEVMDDYGGTEAARPTPLHGIMDHISVDIRSTATTVR